MVLQLKQFSRLINDDLAKMTGNNDYRNCPIDLRHFLLAGADSRVKWITISEGF